MQSTAHRRKSRLLTAFAFGLAASTFCRWVCADVNAATLGATGSTPHWAFQPVRPVTLPPLSKGGLAHPIDRFITAELSQRGLKPNPPADQRALIRRAYFDLIGLPPTPEQVQAFLADPSPSAFEKVIDQLLASPNYGERWGRHWLDAARYADTSGDGADAPVPEARLYRDYVIDAFNADMPYHQFIVEQIAGDLLVKREPGVRERERTLATGFIAVTRRFDNSEYGQMHLVIDNTLDTIGKGMLGMSLSCARCHDHKFDPISTRDYYGLYGYFASTQYPHAGTEQGRARKNFVPLPGGGVAWSVTDKKTTSEISDRPILLKGDPRSKGDIVPRGFLQVLNKSEALIPEGESGRLQFAQWIAAAENPLTTRVAVNRIWQHHFGRGIVPTADTFGKQGQPPTHPELLDWLAGEFVRRGWSFKEMHRLILTSRTWQQSSAANDEMVRRDSTDQFYWRHPLRRLDAEAMRDATLFVSGRLKPGNPGAHPFPKPNEKDEYPYTQHRPFLQDYTHEYRTVYLPSRRLGKNPFMEIFDGPDPNECTGRRTVSTVPLQALFWMNSDVVRDNARSLAERLIASSSKVEERIRTACELAYARSPKPEELRELAAYVRDYAASVEDKADPKENERRAWTSVCRMLMAANEFVYLD